MCLCMLPSWLALHVCVRDTSPLARSSHSKHLHSMSRDAQSGHVPCRLGHPTRHFNVGQYRRKQKGEADVQDAAFFDHNNPARRPISA